MGDQHDAEAMPPEDEERLNKAWDEPGHEKLGDDYSIWMRGLHMIIFAILFGIAEMVLVAFAILQFLWMLFTKERNGFLADTGSDIGGWLRDVTRFQTAATDEKPFPWRRLS